VSAESRTKLVQIAHAQQS